MATNAEQVQAKLNSIRGFKSALTNKINSSVKAIDDANHRRPTKSSVDILQIEIIKVNKASDLLVEKYSELCEFDQADNFEDYMKKIEDEEVRTAEQIKNLIDTISDLEDKINTQFLQPVAATARVQPAGQAQGQGQGFTKVNLALKPFDLTKDSTPLELRSWIEQFKAYHRSSKMELSHISVQQAYFKNCIDSCLAGRLHSVIQPNTPILDDGGCLDLLNDIFTHQFPIFTRRLLFFKAAPEKSQLFSDWTKTLTRDGDECDLPGLRVDEIYVLRYLVGCHDEKLLDLMMREADPTKAKLDAIIMAYEVACVNRNTMSSDPSVQINAASSRGRGGGRGTSRGRGNQGQGRGNQQPRGGSRPQNPGQNSDGKTRQQRIKEIVSQGLCLKCGHDWQLGHDDNCRGFSGTCNSCSRKGHFSTVCLKGFSGSCVIPSNASARNIHVDDSSNHDEETHTRDHSPAYSAVGALSQVVRTKAIKVNKTSSNSSINLPTPRINIDLHTQSGKIFNVNALPDTGATRTLISYDLAQRFGLVPIHARRDIITVANGEHIDCAGAVNVGVFHNGSAVVIDALITSGLQNEILISWYDLRELGIIPIDFPNAKAFLAKSAVIPPPIISRPSSPSYASIASKNI